MEERVHRFEIDLEGNSVRAVALSQPGDLFAGEVASWTPEHLVALLDPMVRDPDRMIGQADLIGWLVKVVQRLLEHDGLTLGRLMRMRHTLAQRLRRRVLAIKAEQRRAAAQQWLLAPAAPVTTLASQAFEFRHGIYDDQAARRGGYTFTKHFLPRVPAFDGKADGEEARCALALDRTAAVETWVRNVARHPASFWLQTSTDKTYPDFVARLGDGRILVVEYKGADRWAAAAEDRAIGAAWERAGGGLYLIVGKEIDGLDPFGQIERKLRA